MLSAADILAMRLSFSIEKKKKGRSGGKVVQTGDSRGGGLDPRTSSSTTPRKKSLSRPSKGGPPRKIRGRGKIQKDGGSRDLVQPRSRKTVEGALFPRVLLVGRSIWTRREVSQKGGVNE